MVVRAGPRAGSRLSALIERVRLPSRLRSPPLTGVLIIALTGTAPVPVTAQGVYRYVDGEGIVTYSQTPPPQQGEVSKVRIAPEPTTAERTEARSDEHSLEARAADLATLQARRRRMQEARAEDIARAREELRRSEEALEMTQISHRADSYRIELMQRQVEMARQNLYEVERGQR